MLLVLYILLNVPLSLSAYLFLDEFDNQFLQGGNFEQELLKLIVLYKG